MDKQLALSQARYSQELEVMQNIRNEYEKSLKELTDRLLVERKEVRIKINKNK